MQPEITVLVSSSPIKSHPSTHIIDETLHTVRERLPHSRIIVMQDGVRPEQMDYLEDYAEYLEAMQGNWPDVEIYMASKHMHQAAMTKATMTMVTDPVIFFVEHDTPLCGKIPFVELGRELVLGDANVIRLMHEAHILEVHEHLTLDRGTPLTKTIQWSQRPHLARSDYYRFILDKYFSEDAKCFIEDRMHGAIQDLWGMDQHWDGIYIYTPEGDQKRSYTNDGREDDPKWDDEQVF